MSKINRRGVMLLLPLLAGLALLAVAASPAVASPGALKVLIVESQCEPTVPPATLGGQILAQPGVASVDFANGTEVTPSDAELSPYDVVVAMGDCEWIDATSLGNNLADYQDQGGVVVGATFDWQGDEEYTLAGRWISGDYSPYQVGAEAQFEDVSLGTHEAGSPLLAGVTSLSAYYYDVVSLTPGAKTIAKWSDGTSAVAVKGDAVAINAYLGDDTSRKYGGDFAKIIVNAGNVLGRHDLVVAKAGSGQGTVTSAPAGIDCGATCSAAFANGAAVTLSAMPASGSTFGGWSGAGCSGASTCQVTMSAAQGVTATFGAIPPRCIVPKLKGKKLKAAKKGLKKADCKLGKVTKKKGATSKSGKVGKQSPKAGKILAPGSRVKVTLKA